MGRMALVPIALPERLPRPNTPAAALIAGARERIEAFVESRRDQPVHAFVPSDFAMVHGALRHVAAGPLAPGDRLCEWGSGAGAAACLAAMAGFDARGIESEPELVALSRRLAAESGLDVRFYCGNFVPHAGQAIAERTGEFEWLTAGAADAYDEMRLDVDDFDVTFAYPWPGEQQVVERLFERFAADGALLTTYNGPAEGMRPFRRQAQPPDAG